MRKKICYLIPLLWILVGCLSNASDKDNVPRAIEILFLGHAKDQHPSREYVKLLIESWTLEGIHITYTEDTEDLNQENLAPYDGLIIYANYDSISPEQEKSLLDFVHSGRGFLPIHSGSYCFRNSEDYIDLVGGQFMKHDTGTFVAQITDPDHPVMQDMDTFMTWDETYVHQHLSVDQHVLMERVEGNRREPWTWVKDYGKGRVFYTAYGHDERTWKNLKFQELLKQGLLWSVGDKVRSRWKEFQSSLPELVYRDTGDIPNYEQRIPPPLYQEPLSPHESKKLIQVPAGFQLKLFAAEPDIINPVAMNWDERGRLWVVETVDYPNTIRTDEEKGDDRIKICEDTDNDGRADKFIIFADGLNIPTSFTFVNGGILISQAPEFIFLKDTNDDDIADVRKVVMEGWGTRDTHAGPSNLQYGMDNHIWGVVGSSGYKGKINGKSLKFGRGIYRFDKNYSDFQLITKTSNNTWGLGFTETNSVFASTANNSHSVYMGIPNRYYRGVLGMKREGSMKIDGHYSMHPVTNKVRQVDVFGGFTAASGHHFYTARNYPDKYWNNYALICEPTGHLVHLAKITRKGAGFKEEDGGNLIAGADEWFSPVEAKVGPDGNVWIADWYNFIVQHNPTPSSDRGGYQAETGSGNAYINPLRDRNHGRIWRIMLKDYDPEKSDFLESLDKNKNDELLAALGNSNLFWRMTAQRLLVENGNDEIAELLIEKVMDLRMDATGNSPAGLHALWTMDGLHLIDGRNIRATNATINSLKHPSASIRRAAIQVLSKSSEGITALKKARMWQDKDPEVQLAGLLIASEWPEDEHIGKQLFDLSKNTNTMNDPWLSQALYIAAATHKQGFFSAYLKENGNYTPGFSSEDPPTIAEQFLKNYWDKSHENVMSQAPTSGKAQVIHIGVVKNEMRYDLSEFVVEAGRSVELFFENSDFMQHNLILGSPGSLEIIGEAADQLALDQGGTAQHYVPDIPEVIEATRLVNPDEKVVLKFTAPEKPGRYPFVCTFPGHWQIMNGFMKVVRNGGS